jgi:hypothetical protein
MKNQQRVVDSNFDRLQARNGTSAKNQSQMVKLLPQLSLSGKKGPDEAQILAKMEKRAQALAELQTTLSKATLSVSKLYVAEKPQQLKKLTAALKTVKTILENKPPLGVSKALKACVNELTSLREGVYLGTATDKKTLSIIACQDATKVVASLIESNAKSIERAKTEALGSEEADEQMYDEALKVLQQTQKESHNLNKIKEHGWAVARVPVIPIAKFNLSVEKLRTLGFKADSVGGYPVIHNQLVIGISKNMLDIKESQKGKSTDPAKFRAVADQLRKELSKHQKVKLHFVDERAYGATGGAWFWVMPEQQLNLLASAFPGKRIVMQRWGFAF